MRPGETQGRAGRGTLVLRARFSQMSVHPAKSWSLQFCPRGLV